MPGDGIEKAQVEPINENQTLSGLDDHIDEIVDDDEEEGLKTVLSEKDVKVAKYRNAKSHQKLRTKKDTRDIGDKIQRSLITGFNTSWW